MGLLDNLTKHIQYNLILKQLRIFHWSKNLILFIPAIASHKIFTHGVFTNSLMGFFSFSLLASSIYIINDIIDRENDKIHIQKMKRPIASGDLTIFKATILCIICISGALYIALIIGKNFLIIVSTYIIINLIYSLFFKKIIVLDIITLMVFYLLRLIAGHFTSNIPLSSWLIACTIFLFFSLGLLKRFIDLKINSENKKYFSKVNIYHQEDSVIIMMIGVASGLISALILILYTNSSNVRILYSSPIILIGLAPLMLYWISRLWLLAYRGSLKMDPVHFALKDINSYIIAITGAFCICIAKYFMI